MLRLTLLAFIVTTALFDRAAAKDDLVADWPAEKEKTHTRQTICTLIESAAAEHEIPVEFFTRLIWKESTFRPAAVSPKGAQGIAQFMPGTAAMRGLADPFDPIEAIPASAKYLRALATRFGNLGLAAAAYNAGEQRVSNWLADGGRLPWETQDYVLVITGRTAEEWSLPDPNVIAGGATASAAAKPEAKCLEVAALLAKPGAGSEIVEDYPKAPWSPWGVQVAGNFSLNRAMASYAAMQKRHPAILAGQLPMVVRAVNRSRGRAPLFQIRVPAGTRDDAAALCRKLQAAGGACVVFKN
jgi:hypothetical protein